MAVSLWRSAVACLLLAACGGEAVSESVQPAGPAIAPAGATPPLSVQDVAQLRILCVVAGDAQAEQIRRDLCAAVTRIASHGATVPVAIANLGDPIVLQPAVLTVIVQGAIERDAEPRLVLALRPYRAGGAETDVLIAPAPRSIPLGDTARLEAALAQALDEILPWRTPDRGPQPIRP